MAANFFADAETEVDASVVGNREPLPNTEFIGPRSELDQQLYEMELQDREQVAPPPNFSFGFVFLFACLVIFAKADTSISNHARAWNIYVAIDYPSMQRVVTTCSAAQAIAKVKCCWCSWHNVNQRRFIDINDVGYPRKRDRLWGNIIDVFRGCRCRTTTDLHCFCLGCDYDKCQADALDDFNDEDSPKYGGWSD